MVALDTVCFTILAVYRVPVPNCSTKIASKKEIEEPDSEEIPELVGLNCRYFVALNGVDVEWE